MSYSNDKYNSVDGDDTKRLPIDHALYKENYFRFEYYMIIIIIVCIIILLVRVSGYRRRHVYGSGNGTHQDCEFNDLAYR